MVHITREFSGTLSQLPDMRGLVREACRQQWIAAHDDAAIDQLELATGEAAANILLHAYRGQSERPVELDVDIDDQRAIVTFYHLGSTFDPQSVPPPVFNAGRESGFGMYLIQQSVDEVQHFRDEQGRCGIRLIKQRRR